MFLLTGKQCGFRKIKWLNYFKNQNQLSTINEYINNIYEENELEKEKTFKKFGISEFLKKPTNYYNLDVIISVGYRVKSIRGTQFRIWANSVLKGVAINKNRLDQLGSVIKIMKRIESSLEAKQVLSVIEKYNSALDLLESSVV